MADFSSHFGKKTAFFLVSGVAAGISAYAVYRHLRKKTKETSSDSSNDEDVSEETPKENRILMVGLDGAGKSSLLACLTHQNCESSPQPTDGFHVICVHTDQDALMNIWEVGGAEKNRGYWTNFIKDTDIVVYVVDSADTKRFTLAGQELEKLLKDERLKGVPFAILANKQDLPNAVPAETILRQLKLDPGIMDKHKLVVVGTKAPPGGDMDNGVEEAKQLLLGLLASS